MTTESLYALLVASIILAMKPGPYVLSLCSLAIAGKGKEILAFLAATYIASTISFFLFLAGVSFLEDHLTFVVIILKALTAAYFIYLGIQGFKDVDGTLEAPQVEASKKRFFERSIPQNFIAGFMLSFSNPFFIIFVVGVVPSIIAVDSLSVGELALARGVVMIADMIVLSVYLVPLYFANKLFSPNILKYIRIASNIAMILIGLYIGYKALPAADLAGL